jgi:microcystin-dependent protein
MADPFLGEIRLFGGNFAPRGWALCNGQLLSISQNSALFAILGTTYGGNGTTTFGLPNLQGQVPIHWGQAPSGTQYTIGETAGTENVTLIAGQMPSHNHLIGVSSAAGDVTSPVNAIAAQVNTGNARNPITTAMGYTDTPQNGTMPANTVSMTGGSQPHPNMQPYLCVTFIIALQGIFPSRN